MNPTEPAYRPHPSRSQLPPPPSHRPAPSSRRYAAPTGAGNALVGADIVSVIAIYIMAGCVHRSSAADQLTAQYHWSVITQKPSSSTQAPENVPRDGQIALFSIRAEHLQRAGSSEWALSSAQRTTGDRRQRNGPNPSGYAVWLAVKPFQCSRMAAVSPATETILKQRRP